MNAFIKRTRSIFYKGVKATKEIKFSCPNPKCNCEVLEEVCEGVTTSQIVEAIHGEDGKAVEAEYGEREVHGSGSGIDRYQCAECGYILRDKECPLNFKIDNLGDLFDWLVDNGKEI